MCQRRGKKINTLVKTLVFARVSTVSDTFRQLTVYRGCSCYNRGKTLFYSKSAAYFLLSEDVCKYPLNFNLLVCGYDYSLNCIVQMLMQSCIVVSENLFSL